MADHVSSRQTAQLQDEVDVLQVQRLWLHQVCCRNNADLPITGLGSGESA